MDSKAAGALLILLVRHALLSLLMSSSVHRWNRGDLVGQGDQDLYYGSCCLFLADTCFLIVLAHNFPFADSNANESALLNDG